MVITSLVAALVLTQGEPSREHQNAVWVQPLGIGIPGLLGTLLVPVGASLQAGEATDWVLEAAPTSGKWYGCGSTRQDGFWASAGVAWHPSSKGLGSGLFVLPKLGGRIFSSTELFSDDCAVSAGVDWEVGLGLDLGFQTVLWRRLYLAFKAGASLNWCENCVDNVPFFMDPLGAFHASRGRTSRPTFGVDLHLLRLGLAW